MAKQIQTWTVRNSKGQLVGRYRALTAERAIQCAKDEQNAYFSQFRGSCKLDDITAKVEE